MQDIDSYEDTQETVALLKILALGSRQVEARDNLAEALTLFFETASAGEIDSACTAKSM